MGNYYKIENYYTLLSNPYKSPKPNLIIYSPNTSKYGNVEFCGEKPAVIELKEGFERMFRNFAPSKYFRRFNASAERQSYISLQLFHEIRAQHGQR